MLHLKELDNPPRWSDPGVGVRGQTGTPVLEPVGRDRPIEEERVTIRGSGIHKYVSCSNTSVVYNETKLTFSIHI